MKLGDKFSRVQSSSCGAISQTGADGDAMQALPKLLEVLCVPTKKPSAASKYSAYNTRVRIHVGTLASHSLDTKLLQVQKEKTYVKWGDNWNHIPQRKVKQLCKQIGVSTNIKGQRSICTLIDEARLKWQELQLGDVVEIGGV